MSDDEIIGLKSTSIKFKKNLKLFVSFTYFLTFIMLIILYKEIINFNVSTALLFIFFLSLIYQLIKFDYKKPMICLNLFKSNNYSGLILFLSILTINL